MFLINKCTTYKQQKKNRRSPKGMNAPPTTSLACMAKFLSKSRVSNSRNENLISLVTFVHKPCIYSYFAASFESLS